MTESTIDPVCGMKVVSDGPHHHDHGLSPSRANHLQWAALDMQLVWCRGPDADGSAGAHVDGVGGGKRLTVDGELVGRRFLKTIGHPQWARGAPLSLVILDFLRRGLGLVFHFRHSEVFLEL